MLHERACLLQAAWLRTSGLKSVWQAIPMENLGEASQVSVEQNGSTSADICINLHTAQKMGGRVGGAMNSYA